MYIKHFKQGLEPESSETVFKPVLEENLGTGTVIGTLKY